MGFLYSSVKKLAGNRNRVYHELGDSLKKHNLAITLFTVASSPLPYTEKLKKIREIGYRSIQSGLPPDGLELGPYKTLLDELEIEICAFSGRPDILFPSPGKFIEACRLFECDEIMIGSMPVEYRENSDSYLRGIELLNKNARILRKEGIYLSYHNHAQEFRKFSSGKRGIDLLFENLDSEAVRFLPDTHWLQAGGADILEWMDKFHGRMKYLHVKDYRLAPANYNTPISAVEKQFAQIGDGQLPWEMIIQKGLELGIKAFIVEQDNCYNEDPFDCAAQSFSKLLSLGLS